MENLTNIADLIDVLENATTLDSVGLTPDQSTIDIETFEYRYGGIQDLELDCDSMEIEEYEVKGITVLGSDYVVIEYDTAEQIKQHLKKGQSQPAISIEALRKALQDDSILARLKRLVEEYSASETAEQPASE